MQGTGDGVMRPMGGKAWRQKELNFQEKYH